MALIKMYQELQSIDGKRKYDGLLMLSVVSDVPKESEPLNIDCSDVDTQEESACTHLLEPAVASSSLDEDCLQESDALAFTDSDCSNSCAWFFNESESTTFKCRFEEPAVTLKPFSFDKT